MERMYFWMEGTQKFQDAPGIFTYIWIKRMIDVGKYSMHGASGYSCFTVPASSNTDYPSKLPLKRACLLGRRP